ncbi:hypothetical protein EI94DRAFT_1799632 [Lactarius quietus]|nr:hypothetical protein EI94DRAFT_1799632 [Lactarius quietus]
MAARPLPGATYHTADIAFHAFPDVDLEAVDSYGPSEKSRIYLPVQTPKSMARLRRGPPVMLILLVLCCLSFVAKRHAQLAADISAAARTGPNKEWVHGTQEKAWNIMKQKHNTSRVGCHAANVRGYMRQTFSAVLRTFTHWTNVSQSAVVLHWQGADSKLKPVIISSTHGQFFSTVIPSRDVNPAPEVLDIEDRDPIDSVKQCGTKPIEHLEELADVDSAVGMLTAVEALAQSGYQPLRTLVLSLTLGETADIWEVSHYLHATYDEQGLEMGIKLPPLLHMRVAALFSTRKQTHCQRVFDDDHAYFAGHSD